jgi:ankyrin repeat protein
MSQRIEWIRPRREEFGNSWNCDPDDVWAMLCAARDGDVATIQKLLQKDSNLVRAEFWYTQPLHFAVREGHMEAIRVLLDAGADPTVIRYGGEELATVARDRNHEAAAVLVEEARRQRSIGTPHEIHAASKAGDTEKVRSLLEADPTLINSRDDEGSTPLHHAVNNGSLELVGLLLDHGADIEAVSGVGGTYHDSGFSVLDCAVWSGGFFKRHNDWEMAKFLLSRGAKSTPAVAAALGDFDEVRRLVNADPGAVNEAQPCGRRPLSVAVESSHFEIAKYLLANSADPNLPEGRYAPRGIALHAAARLKNYEMAKLLLEHGAAPEGFINASGFVWHVADKHTRLLLYQYGLKADRFDLDNYDALAVYADHDPEGLGRADCGGVFAMLVNRGARTPEETETDEMILRMLLGKGVRVPDVLTGCRGYLWKRPHFTRILLEHGMNPNLPNWQHVTPLHELCNVGVRGQVDPNRIELADMFLEFGADINAREEEYSSTPLGWAARNGLKDMAEWLLEHGAKTNLPDDEEWATPLVWARKRGHAEIEELLLTHGATA